MNLIPPQQENKPVNKTVYLRQPEPVYIFSLNNYFFFLKYYLNLCKIC